MYLPRTMKKEIIDNSYLLKFMKTNLDLNKIID
jgi:hypothetical protein